jgi:hypothetical protein
MRRRTGVLIAATCLAAAPAALTTASAPEAQPSPPATDRTPAASHSRDGAYRSSVTYTFTDPRDRNSAYQSVLVVESSRALSPAELRAINH